MRLTVIGCSGSFAGPASPASSYLVQSEHDGRTASILLDLGSGALGVLHRHLDPASLDAVFLSHLHPDHCVDTLGLYVSRRYRPQGHLSHPLPVWGPPGTGRWVEGMYIGMRPGGMAAEFAFADLADAVAVEVGPFRVTPYAVNHPVPAFGLRVETDGATLAYTGDTDSCDNLVPLMTGADLVLADSAFVDGRDHLAGIHLSGRRAAEAALAAGGVRRLMLTHLPVWNDPEVCRSQAAAVWPGEVELAEPDAAYEL